MSKVFEISGTNNDDAILNCLPTLNVVRSGTVSLAGIRCLNIIGGFDVKLSTVGLLLNQQLFIVSTSSGASTLRADTATIGGAPTYSLKSGGSVSFLWDGTNFQIQ